MIYCGAYFKNLYRIDPKMSGRGTLLTDNIEKILSSAADKGRTVVFRPVVCEGDFEADEELIKLIEADGDLYCNGKRRYPNWDNQRLIEYFLDFIKQFGKAYDGDKRIAMRAARAVRYVWRVELLRRAERAPEVNYHVA